MREVGYSKHSAIVPQVLTESKTWREQMEDFLPDEKLLKAHQKLLSQKQVQYFTFPKSMSDEEIISQVNRAGFEVITVNEAERSKYAFYSIDNSQAISKALEMAYRLKGRDSDDKNKNLATDGEFSSLEAILTKKVTTIKEQTLRLGKNKNNGITGNI